MTATREQINSIIATMKEGKSLWDAMEDEGISKEHTLEVNTLIFNATLADRYRDMPLENLQEIEANFLHNLQVLSEIIAEKMA